MGASPCPHFRSRLAFRLAACQLLHLALFRSTGVIAGFLGLLRFALLARCPFRFLAFFFAQLCCIGHDCCILPLLGSDYRFIVALSCDPSTTSERRGTPLRFPPPHFATPPPT